MKNITEFSNDMMLKYDINLDTHLKGGTYKIDAFFDRVKLVVIEEIKSNNPNYRESLLEEPQKVAIWNAILEQGFYMINNYDMNVVSGYDPISNTVISVDEIRKRAFSPLAKKMLTNAGLFYSGIRSRHMNYFDKRDGWR